MKGFKFEPVRWASWLFALLTALLGANQLVDQLGGADVIPSSAVPYLLFAEAVLALLLGKVVRDRVTPLARPRGLNDEPLVPKSVQFAPSSTPGGLPGGRGMADW